MKINLPQYSRKDYVVLAILALPVTLALNSLLFGRAYFLNWKIFFTATFITAFTFSFYFVACGIIASILKKRMPEETQTSLRILCMMVCFVSLSGFFLATLFNGYELFPSFHYTFNTNRFIWAYVSMAIINIFVTLLMEGIYRYNYWRENLKETEKIKKTFTQSQMLALKSQVNPHFLFNSLNTLSSLIAEDEKEAESFLNEMSKVYRYMLRGDDEQLVPLQSELRFIDSYLHLLTKRYGHSLQVKQDIDEADQQKLVPPLSLQVLIENAFTQNSMSKTEPLQIHICSQGGKEILVRNNRKPKKVSNVIDFETGLDNLVTKYRLLTASRVVIRDEVQQRSVFLPLIQNKGGAQ